MRKITFCFFILIAAVSAHAQWADLGTASQTEVDHLCAAVPAPNGLAHDIYCAGDNPEILPSGAISTTGINVNGTATLTTISTSTVSLSGTLSTTALYVGGSEITGGGGTPNVLNPTECNIGEAPTWSTADNDFICPESAELGFDFNQTNDFLGDGSVLTSNIEQINGVPPGGWPVTATHSAAPPNDDEAIEWYTCTDGSSITTCISTTIATGTFVPGVGTVPTEVNNGEYVFFAMQDISAPVSISITIDTQQDEWIVTP